MTFCPISGMCSDIRKAEHFSWERVSMLESALAVPLPSGKAGAGHPQVLLCCRVIFGSSCIPHLVSLAGSAALHPTGNFSG